MSAHDSEAEIARELRLRASPPTVTRLSRKVLIGGAALAIALIGGATWWALDGHRAKPAVAETAASSVPPNLPDKVNQLPRDYAQPGAVPKLGPPLPGDLGPPILAAQGRLGEAATGLAGGAPSQPLEVNPAQNQEEQTRAAARTSRLFTSLGETAPATPTLADGARDLASTAATSAAQEANAAPKDHKLAFLAEPDAKPQVNPARLLAPASPYLIQAGTLIDGALITGIRSDLPGQVTAQVTEDVRDSVTGRWLLIPQGSRLIGTYDHDVGFGQSRVLLAWTRLILPNGKSLDLGRAPAADRAGFAGLQDGVDHHWRALFGAAVLSTILGVGSDLGASNQDSDLVQALRHGSQETFNQAGEEAVRRQLEVQPTLTIRPGHAVRIVVERDLVLEPYEASR